MDKISSSDILICPKCPRRYIIIYTHPGWKYNLGNVPQNSANTHAKEIKNNTFPNLPKPPFDITKDRIFIYYCNNVYDKKGIEPNYKPGQEQYQKLSGNKSTDNLISILNSHPDNSIAYLAIFAHSGRSAMFFHPSSIGWANLNNKQVPIFGKLNKYFNPIQIRLFGCYSGYGTDNLAEVFKKSVPNSTVYAYNFRGGAYGTNDKAIGHGKKIVPNKPPNPKNGDTWFSTYSPGRKSSFKKF